MLSENSKPYPENPVSFSVQLMETRKDNTWNCEQFRSRKFRTN